MAGVEITISGVLYDRVNRTAQNVVLIGEAMLSGVGIGGGPIYPPSGGGGGEGIWGPTDPRPTPPIHLPPGGVPPGVGGGPIIPVPPDSPHLPAPGSPPMIIGGTHPSHPVEPPPAVVIEYPGIGKVVVPKPTETVPRPEPKPEQQGAPRR